MNSGWKVKNLLTKGRKEKHRREGAYPEDCLLNPYLSCLLKQSSIIINHLDPGSKKIEPVLERFFFLTKPSKNDVNLKENPYHLKFSYNIQDEKDQNKLIRWH